MPRADRTGPLGEGPMTGRGLGICAGGGKPGFFNRMGFGRGFGRGMGRGAGRGFGLGAYPSQGESGSLLDEIKALKDKISFLEKELGNK